MKTKGSSKTKDRRGSGADHEAEDRSNSVLPLALHFEGAGMILSGAALLVTLVATALMNAHSGGHVVGGVSIGVAGGNGAARTVASIASPLLLCGYILVVLGALFGSSRGEASRSTLRPKLARLSAALWGVALALLLTRAPLGHWLAEHVTWGATALRVGRWLVTLAALGTMALVVRANAVTLEVRKSLRTIDVGIGLVAVQVVVSAFHNALLGALWNSRFRALHGALELAGSLGLIVAGLGIFAVARSMHHAWIESSSAASSRS